MYILTTSVGGTALLALLAFGRVVVGGPIPADIRGDVIISIPNGHRAQNSTAHVEPHALKTSNTASDIDTTPPLWRATDVLPWKKHRHSNTPRSEVITSVMAKVSRIPSDDPIAATPREHETPAAAKPAKAPRSRPQKGQPESTLPRALALERKSPNAEGPTMSRTETKVKVPEMKYRTPVPVEW
ncbi:hypothetical protein FQN49_007674 [Arthroderma sp. PD_2]|nr:hypothetical protein FQN49_007674 [Arthroderma sp. PD_2]